MTTDTTALQERIARALNDEGWTFEGVHEPGDYDECEGCRRTVAPIAARIAEEVAAEVRKAQGEAWTDCVSEASALGWLHAPAALDMLDRNPHEKED